MAKANKPHYVAEIKLNTCENDRIFLQKVFRCSERIEQKLQAYAIKAMGKLRKDPEYLDTLEAYRAVKEKLKASKEDPALDKERKRLGKLLSARAAYFGLSKGDMEYYVKEQQHKAKRYVGSLVAQKIAYRVMKGVESCLYGKGSISGKGIPFLP